MSTGDIKMELNESMYRYFYSIKLFGIDPYFLPKTVDQIILDAFEESTVHSCMRQRCMHMESNKFP